MANKKKSELIKPCIRRRYKQDGTAVYDVEVRIKDPITNRRIAHRDSFLDFKEAERWRDSKKVETRDGKHGENRHTYKKTLANLIDTYIEKKLPLRNNDKVTVKGHLVWWRKVLGEYRLKAIKPIHIQEFLGDLLEGRKDGKPLAPATVVRYHSSLSSCFEYGIRQLEWLESNPCSRVDKPKVDNCRERILDRSERIRLIKTARNIHSYLELILRIGFETGARRGEILNLKINDLELTQHNKHYVHFRKTKNGDHRVNPISVELYTDLISLQSKQANQQQADNYLFPGNAEDGKFYLRSRLERLRRETKIDFTFHNIRHTVASIHQANGKSPLLYGKMIGHRDVRSMLRYSHATYEFVETAHNELIGVLF
jgi:integrase